MQLEDQCWNCPHCGRAMKSAKKLDSILKAVAARHGLRPADITSECRSGPVVAARLDFYYIAARDSQATYMAIARFCGSRDHTTIISGVERHCKRFKLDLPRARWGREKRRQWSRQMAIDNRLSSG